MAQPLSHAGSTAVSLAPVSPRKRHGDPESVPKPQRRKVEELTATVGKLFLAETGAIAATGQASTPATLPAHRFDAFFAESAEDVNRLINACMEQEPETPLTLVSNANHFDQQGITITPVVDQDHEGRTLEQLRPGILNGTQPATLIIDCRRMSPKTIAAYNELLDQPPRFRGQPVNPACRILVLIESAMIPAPGNTANKCGDDFWRRISRCGNSWTIPAQGTATLPCDRLPVLTATQEENDTDLVLDFSTTTEWQQLLFGRVVLGRGNQRHYSPGPLFKATHSQQYQRVILRAAPWHDSRFRLAISQLLVRQSYQANGSTHRLEGLTFVRQEADRTQLAQLKKAVTFTNTCDPSFFCLNKHNIEECLGENAIDSSAGADAQIVAKDVLLSLIRKCGGLRITSPLSADHWHRLLLRIQPLAINIPIVVDSPFEQPLEYAEGMPASNTPPPTTPAQRLTSILIACENDETLLSGAICGLYDNVALTLSVTPDMELPQLLGELEVNSMSRMSVNFQSSSLIGALERGERVILRNLHKNPVLQRQLESLCCHPPRLLINGQLRTFRRASIIVPLPEGSTFSSPVWKSLPPRALKPPLKQPDLCLQALSDIHRLDNNDQIQLRQTRAFLNQALAGIPASSSRQWPSPPQAAVLPVLTKILNQVRRQQTTATANSTAVWRQAISQMVLEEYRGHREMFACLQQLLLHYFPLQGADAEPWLDPAPFKALLASKPVLDQTVLNEYCWRLSRAVSPACFPRALTNYNHFPPENMQVLVQALLACCPEQRRESLRASLACHLPPLSAPLREQQPLPPPADQQAWQQWQRQRLDELENLVRDNPLVFLKGEPGGGKTWSATAVANRLNPAQPPVVITANPQSSQSELLRVPISTDALCLTSRQLETATLSPEEQELFRQLAEAHGQIETAVSNGDGPRYRIPLTPVTKKILKTRFSQDCQQKLAIYKDASVRYQAGPLLRWATACSRDGSPVVLIVDEANLAPAALWDIFQGLHSGDIPSLCYGGEVLPLTPEHRIIFTGNMESAPGRSSSLNLRQQAVTRYFPALPEGFLEHQILRPRLRDMGISETLEEPVSRAIISLWQQFLSLAPKHEFSPRDVHELCDRLRLYLRLETPGTISKEVVLRLVWLAVSETLSGSCLQESEAIDSLEFWYQSHLFPEGGMPSTKAEQLFDAQLQHLKINDIGFCYEGASIAKLTQVYWSALYKRQQEVAEATVFQGKRATLVEGPAGRGKDVLLHRLMNSSGIHYEHLNADCLGWPAIRDTLKRAAKTGTIVIISELNLLPSQYLEGELNQILTGEVSPGFHLFATVNPAEFSGREQLSPALQSRFVNCRIGDYSDIELDTIARNRFQLPPETVNQVVQWHCQLRHTIQAMGTPYLQPGTSTLLALLDNIRQQPALGHQALRDSFSSLYCIALRCAGKKTPDELAPIAIGSLDTMMDTGSHSRELIKPLYAIFPDMGPIKLRKGTEYIFHPDTRELRIPEVSFRYGQLGGPDTVENAVRAMVEGMCHSSGMPVPYPDKGDTLSYYLFNQWQRTFTGELLSNCPERQHWIDRWYPIPDSEATNTTLALAENQPLIAEAREFLAANGTTASPVLYRRFLGIMSPWRYTTEEQIQEQERQQQASAVMETDTTAAEPEPAAELPRVAWGGGWVTSFNPVTTGTGAQINVVCVFNGYSYRQERRAIMAPLYSPERGASLAYNMLGGSGFNQLECTPKPEQQLLENGEEPGRVECILTANSWTRLPSLTSPPRARLKYLNLTPALPYEVVQDRASGVHLVRLLAPPPEQNGRVTPCTLDFVLELTSGISPQKLGLATGHAYCDCPEDIITVIRESKDPAIMALRNKLDTITSAEHRILLIAEFCSDPRQFRSSRSLLARGRGQLSELLLVRPSDSESRAVTFWMLASYYRIPVRFSRTGDGGVVAEVSLDGGYTQANYNLQARIKDGAIYVAQKQDFSNIPKKPEKQLEDYFYESCSAEDIADLLDTTHTGTSDYEELAINLARLVVPVISLSGPVSVGKLTNWLKNFSIQAEPTLVERRHDMLCSLMHGLVTKMDSEPSEELSAVYRKLSRFILEQGWLPTGASSSMIHFLQQFNEAERHKAVLYNQTFTHDLLASHDIRMRGQPLYPEVTARYARHYPSETIEGWVTKNDQEAKSEIDASVLAMFKEAFQYAHSPKLLQTLYGEMPSTQYRSAPPGTLDLQRVVYQRPAYRCSASAADLRPVLVVAPWKMSQAKLVINNTILPLIEDRGREIDHAAPREQLSMANMLATYIPRYACQAFLDYLFHKGGGEVGSLRVLFPSDPDRPKETPLTTPYLPAKAGWVAPENPEDFIGLLSTMPYEFADDNTTGLRQEWASQAFNQSNLCLVDSKMLFWLLEDYLRNTDWRNLIKTVLRHPAWKEYVQKELDSSRDLHVRMLTNAEIRRLDRRGECEPLGDIKARFDTPEIRAEITLYDDIRDDLKD